MHLLFALFVCVLVTVQHALTTQVIAKRYLATADPFAWKNASLHLKLFPRPGCHAADGCSVMYIRSATLEP